MVSVIVRWCSLSLVGQTAWTKGLLLCCKIIPPNQSKEAAFPMIVAVGSTLKYRPSSESADCEFMRKTSLSART